MSNTLGCLALVLAAAGAGAGPDAKPEITYRFRMVEVRGLSWRAPGQANLSPVAQHGGVSVWTAPGDFIESLQAEAQGLVTTDAIGRAAAHSPSHVTTRTEQSFVTRIAWKGPDKAPKPTTEGVREGIAATVIGRKLDQGVLVQLVIEDTDVRSVHTIPVPSPAPESSAKTAKTARIDAPLCDTSVEVTSSMHGECCSETAAAAPCEDAECVGECPSAAQTSQSGWAPTDKARTDERLSRASARATVEPGAAIQLPEIGRASAAGEWLIPSDGVLVIGFGPHTVADADGKAVVREHLAVVSADAEDLDLPHVATIVPPPPAVAPPQASEPTQAPVPVPRTAAATPGLPSRTLPQGVHADGTPAALPPLPDDEKDAAPAPAADDSKSSEPLPSPQTKRNARPAAEPTTALPPLPIPTPEGDAKAKPNEKDAPTKADGKASKAAFLLPQLSQIKPLSLLPFSFPGAQFVLPLKALGVKLPFNQKLEFELLGRIIPDPDAIALEPIVAVDH